MIQSLEINGYRCFDRFEMSGLKRVNLLVGKNGSGKTSILEALYVLSAGGRGEVWPSILNRRGEWPRASNRPLQQYLCHLFPGHVLTAGSKFTVSAKNSDLSEAITCDWRELSPDELNDQYGYKSARPLRILIMRLRANGAETTAAIIPSDISTIKYTYLGPLSDSALHAKYLTPYSPKAEELITWWNNIALTPNEQLVLQALRFLDPRIEGIAPEYEASVFGWFKVKLIGQDLPVPIGSLGNGMSRMLAIAVAITQCKKGILLVDEIDSGLHYTALGDMWKLVGQTAENLDVQVFATTHSHDCVRSLAGIAHDGSVTIQRIEAGRPAAVAYSENQVRVAAEHDIEVR
jgi:energy-coupling factor transporter ATP-binding protein EcfA2